MIEYKNLKEAIEDLSIGYPEFKEFDIEIKIRIRLDE